MKIRSILFAFVFVFLAAQANDPCAAATTGAHLSCTFEPVMGKALEVLSHLDEDYKDHTIAHRADTINILARTGSYDGPYKTEDKLKLSGLQYGRPANNNETCLIFKTIIRTASQTSNPSSVRNAAENIKRLRGKKSADYQHQLITLIVSILAHSEQTVRLPGVIRNTERILKEVNFPAASSGAFVHCRCQN
jgi:hypothetical protein